MAATDAQLGAIRRVLAFAALDPGSAQALAALLQERRLATGDVLFRQGEPGSSMAVVGSGELSVRVRDAGNEATEVARVREGEVLGDMACIDPAPRSAEVVAAAPSVVYLLDRADLRLLAERAPKVATGLTGHVIADVTRRLRDTNRRIEKEARRRGMPVAGRPPRDTQALHPAPYLGQLDLAKVPMLKGFSARDLSTLETAAPARLYLDGTWICREGTPGTSCFILVQGDVQVCKWLDGQEQVLCTLPRGTVVGQMALVDRGPRSASIRALGAVIALELPKAAFQRLVEAATPVGLHFQEQVAVAGIRQLRKANEQLAGLFAPAPRQPVGQPLPPLTARESGTMNYIRAALKEWNMSMEDLGRIDFVRQDPIPSGALAAARARQMGGVR